MKESKFTSVLQYFLILRFFLLKIQIVSRCGYKKPVRRQPIDVLPSLIFILQPPPTHVLHKVGGSSTTLRISIDFLKRRRMRSTRNARENPSEDWERLQSRCFMQTGPGHGFTANAANKTLPRLKVIWQKNVLYCTYSKVHHSVSLTIVN